MRTNARRPLFWILLTLGIVGPAIAMAQGPVWCVCLKPNGQEQHYTHQKVHDIPQSCRKHRATIVPRGMTTAAANKTCRTGRYPTVKSAPTASAKPAKKKRKSSQATKKKRSTAAPKLKAPGAKGKPETEFNDLIAEAAKMHGVPELLVHAVIRVESNYKPTAVSSAGAQGLMQLMPATAQDLGVKDSFDPRQNIQGGTRYLKRLSNHFNGDVVKALAGYHAGFRAVEREDRIPFTATEGYVKKVLGHYYRMKQTESGAK